MKIVRGLAIAAGTSALLAGGAHAQNLISNPSFEAPVIGAATAGCIQHGSWMTCDSAAVPGWTFKWVDDETPGRLEFQNIIAPTDGSQYVELSSDDRPGDARVEISQDVTLSLCPLDEYTLTYDHRQRNGDDILTVAVNDTDVTPALPAPTTTAWNSYSVPIAPVAASINVAFAEEGPAGTLGSFLDNVSLTNDFVTSACPALDAKPGSYPNGANLCKGGGVVPVAFVGNEFFDPNDWEIIGVFLSSDAGTGDPIVGRGKSEVCKIENVVDGTNPSEITPDAFDDIVCHIPTTDMSLFVDTTGVTDAVVQVCLTLNDGIGGDNITICASDELKLSRQCTTD